MLERRFDLAGVGSADVGPIGGVAAWSRYSRSLGTSAESPLRAQGLHRLGQYVGSVASILSAWCAVVPFGSAVWLIWVLRGSGEIGVLACLAPTVLALSGRALSVCLVSNSGEGTWPLGARLGAFVAPCFGDCVWCAVVPRSQRPVAIWVWAPSADSGPWRVWGRAFVRLVGLVATCAQSYALLAHSAHRPGARVGFGCWWGKL